MFLKRFYRRHIATSVHSINKYIKAQNTLFLFAPRNGYGQNATRCSKDICDADVYVLVKVCAREPLSNLAKLFIICANNVKSCYIICFLMRKISVHVNREQSEQRAHHAMLKVILHVSAYDFFLLPSKGCSLFLSFDTVCHKIHASNVVAMRCDVMTVHMKVFFLATFFCSCRNGSQRLICDGKKPTQFI